MSDRSLESRVVRYKDLVPCTNAFVDSRTPGSDTKENFTIIGPGVSENPNQHVHIAEPHGFNIGGARQPPKCLNSQHSHLTAEVFVAHTGQWRFLFGVNADEGHVDLGPGDTISIPPDMFRGFENIGTESGFLFAVLGSDSPGKVTWAPVVFDMARDYGLVLLEGGKLIDTSVGEAVPDGARRASPPDAAEVAALSTPALEKLVQCVAPVSSLIANSESPLTANGVQESAVITPDSDGQVTGDGFKPGPISGWWKHGFNLRRLELSSQATTVAHIRHEVEILFVHQGELAVSSPDGECVLGVGDTMSVPAGLERSFANNSKPGPSALDTVVYVVRGGDSPAAPSIV